MAHVFAAQIEVLKAFEGDKTVVSSIHARYLKRIDSSISQIPQEKSVLATLGFHVSYIDAISCQGYG